MIAGGLSYKGPFKGRPQDALSFIFAYGNFSSDLAQSQRELGQPVQDFEILFEMNYRIQLLPWLFIEPDVQVIVNPDGRKDIDDALVIGFAVGTLL